MKKSKTVSLSGIFLTAILSCNNPNDQWVSGYKDSQDTVVNNHPYRFYNGYWYPVFNNMINPGRYKGATHSELTSPLYHPSIRTGGFGSSAHFSSAS